MRGQKVCPKCAETVKKAALICKHCGTTFEQEASQPERKAHAPRIIFVVAILGMAAIITLAHLFPPSGEQALTPAATVAGPSPQTAGLDPALQPKGTYSFTISASGGASPTIVGTTSVPNGTVVLVNIKRPYLPDAQQRLGQGLSACGDSCLPATGPAGESTGVNATVQQGRFSAGPFSLDGKPLSPGTYPVEIFIIPNNKDDLVSQAGVNALTNPAATSQIRVLENGEVETTSEGPSASQNGTSKSDQAGAVRYTNPADNDFCNQSAIIQSMYTGSAGSFPGQEFHIEHVTAGENSCESNVPGLCKAEPAPGKHVCHAFISVQDGRNFVGNFYIDEANPAAIYFSPDAH